MFGDTALYFIHNMLYTHIISFDSMPTPKPKQATPNKNK